MQYQEMFADIIDLLHSTVFWQNCMWHTHLCACMINCAHATYSCACMASKQCHQQLVRVQVSWLPETLLLSATLERQFKDIGHKQSYVYLAIHALASMPFKQSICHHIAGMQKCWHTLEQNHAVRPKHVDCWYAAGLKRCTAHVCWVSYMPQPPPPCFTFKQSRLRQSWIKQLAASCGLDWHLNRTAL
jgi:hypothetical protein